MIDTDLSLMDDVYCFTIFFVILPVMHIRDVFSTGRPVPSVALIVKIRRERKKIRKISCYDDSAMCEF